MTLDMLGGELLHLLVTTTEGVLILWYGKHYKMSLSTDNLAHRLA